MSSGSNSTPPHNSEPSCTETSDVSSSTSFSEYVSNRVATWSAISAVVGVSSGYYQGHRMPLYFYTYGLTGCLVSGVYFSSTFLLSQYRKQNDLPNHGLSGALTGAFVGAATGGYKRIIFTTVVGVLAGGLYKVGGFWICSFPMLP